MNSNLDLYTSTVLSLFKEAPASKKLHLLKILTEGANKTKRTVKVAYNACYGGFSLSPLACSILDQLDPLETPRKYDVRLSRDHPYLVTLIEELGVLANGSHAILSVEEVEVGLAEKWYIHEYDGLECVITEPSDKFREPTVYDLKYSLDEVRKIIQEFPKDT